eukprot:jgi/Chlat1/4153/Chrsp27S00312
MSSQVYQTGSPALSAVGATPPMAPINSATTPLVVEGIETKTPSSAMLTTPPSPVVDPAQRLAEKVMLFLNTSPTAVSIATYDIDAILDGVRGHPSSDGNTEDDEWAVGSMEDALSSVVQPPSVIDHTGAVSLVDGVCTHDGRVNPATLQREGSDDSSNVGAVRKWRSESDDASLVEGDVKRQRHMALLPTALLNECLEVAACLLDTCMSVDEQGSSLASAQGSGTVLLCRYTAVPLLQLSPMRLFIPRDYPATPPTATFDATAADYKLPMMVAARKSFAAATTDLQPPVAIKGLATAWQDSMRRAVVEVFNGSSAGGGPRRVGNWNIVEKKSSPVHS